MIQNKCKCVLVVFNKVRIYVTNNRFFVSNQINCLGHFVALASVASVYTALYNLWGIYFYIQKKKKKKKKRIYCNCIYIFKGTWYYSSQNTNILSLFYNCEFVTLRYRTQCWIILYIWTHLRTWLRGTRLELSTHDHFHPHSYVSPRW